MLLTSTPHKPLPEMMFPAPATVPPTVLLALVLSTPSLVLPRAAVPAALVPT